MYVAVSGPGRAQESELSAAERVGSLLAEHGAIVVTGGLGGVMEAASRGAKSAEGLTLGILPGWDRSDANPWVDVALPTGMGEMRNSLLVRAADVMIAIAGEFGTLSEVALALKTGVPVVGLGTWELHKGGHAVAAFEQASDPESAVELALRGGI
ncbi:MAG: TIGR00725 family protein [Actinomycetota bacterium]|nr:TIGR00725 family protein [Actinomycetota bacterium]